MTSFGRLSTDYSQCNLCDKGDIISARCLSESHDPRLLGRVEPGDGDAFEWIRLPRRALGADETSTQTLCTASVASRLRRPPRTSLRQRDAYLGPLWTQRPLHVHVACSLQMPRPATAHDGPVARVRRSGGQGCGFGPQLAPNRAHDGHDPAVGYTVSNTRHDS
jgi:hypothetical protein